MHVDRQCIQEEGNKTWSQRQCPEWNEWMNECGHGCCRKYVGTQEEVCNIAHLSLSIINSTCLPVRSLFKQHCSIHKFIEWKNEELYLYQLPSYNRSNVLDRGAAPNAHYLCTKKKEKLLLRERVSGPALLFVTQQELYCSTRMITTTGKVRFFSLCSLIRRCWRNCFRTREREGCSWQADVLTDRWKRDTLATSSWVSTTISLSIVCA